MEFIRSVFSGAARGVLWPFAGLHPLLSLIPLGVLLGVVLLWAFPRISNQEAISAVKRRLQAHLYEIRLYVDEPKLIWKAQAALVTDNLRYLGLMLVPAAVLTIPLVPLFSVFNCFYGVSPLHPGVTAVLTAQLTTGTAMDEGAVRLELPQGLVADAPAVRVVADDQISWRLRTLKPLSGDIRIVVGDEAVTKSVVVGSGPRYVSRRRVSSSLALFQYPGESQLEAESIDWIEVSFPATDIEWLGLRLHWMIWLLAVTMVTALVLRRRFHVTF
jgi:hypothetical protein